MRTQPGDIQRLQNRRRNIRVRLLTLATASLNSVEHGIHQSCDLFAFNWLYCRARQFGSTQTITPTSENFQTTSSQDSANTRGERGAHRRGRVQRTENLDRCNRCQRQFRRYIIGNSHQADDLDIQHLSLRLHAFKFTATNIVQAENQRPARYGSFDFFAMHRKLITNGGADQIGAIGIKSFLHQKVNLTEIDDAQIDREFFGIGRDAPWFCSSDRFHDIHIPSIWMV
nr:hypothetical protein [Pseudolysobacter antarcticus]